MTTINNTKRPRGHTPIMAPSITVDIDEPTLAMDWLDLDLDDSSPASTARAAGTRKNIKNRTRKSGETLIIVESKGTQKNKIKTSRSRKAASNSNHATLPSANDNETAELMRLPSCKSEGDIGMLRSQWTSTFNGKALRAVSSERRKQAIGEPRLDSINRLFDGSATDVPTLLDGKVLNKASEHLAGSLIALMADNPRWEVALVTIVTGDGATSSNVPVINLAQQRQRAKKIFAKCPRTKWASSSWRCSTATATHLVGGSCKAISMRSSSEKAFAPKRKRLPQSFLQHCRPTSQARNRSTSSR